MTRDQYSELVDFLGRKFEGIDQRFEGIDQRFEEARRERAENLDQARRHATVLFETLRSEMRVMGEGLAGRIDSVEDKVGSLTTEVRSLDESVRLGFVDHERRIRVLEG